MRIFNSIVVYGKDEIYNTHEEKLGRYFIYHVCGNKFEIIDSAKINKRSFKVLASAASFEIALTICKLLLKNYEESQIKVSNLYDYSEKRIDINKKYGG